jgi:hypothetical protein
MILIDIELHAFPMDKGTSLSGLAQILAHEASYALITAGQI